ncbi:hypothetical protein CsatB_007271 [Cannabis sativa]
MKTINGHFSMSLLLLRVGIRVWCGCSPTARDEKIDIDGADFDGIGIDRLRRSKP